jgi:hypothetical protein
MEEIGDNRKTVIGKLLVFVFNEAKRYFPYEGCPTAVGAPRTEYSVTKGEGI